MRFTNFKLVAAASLLSLAMATVASAQATRTWVSGVGDDANPCSRTAPCKTFAGAISKTASGGEINVIDPGGFGAVTITKSITIDGYGQESSVLNPSVNGIVINAAGISVNLRNIEINGAGSGLDGVKVFAASQVNLHNVAVFGQTHAYEVVSTSQVKTNIHECKFFQNTQTAAVINPGGGGSTMVIDDSILSNNGLSAGTAGGVFAANSTVVVKNSVVSNNTAPGVEAGSGGAILVDNSDLSYNSVGAQADASGAIRLSRSTITGCTNAISATGSVFTYGDNRIGCNTSNNGAGMTAANPALQ